MRHQPTDRREVSGRSNRQATWSAVATVMIAGTSVALAQSATPAQPPVNTGLSNLPMLPPTPKQATGGGASQNRNFTPPTPSEPPAGEPMYDAQAAGEPGNEPAPGDVKVDDNLIVDLHLNNEDLSKVLEMLSIQSQRNIVASGGISNAKVSANLYGVTFYEALDAILHPNGYGYIDRGNMIYVHTLEELKQIEQASRVRVSKLVTLSYLNAIDAAEFVKPLLSEGGSIKTPGKTKDFSIPGETPTGADEYALDATLVVYDYEENVAEIEKLLKGLDTKPAQVLVEATIVQTALNENNAFGVDFSLIADMNFADFSGIGGPLKAVDSMISGKGGQLTGGSSVPLQVPADDEGRGLVSTPGNTAGPGTLKLGIVDKDVAVFVKMLDEVSDTTILSNPKILAVNRQPSRVLVGRKVGYLSTTSTDTTTTQTVEFLDTGTQLYFRPFVSLNDNMIRMELKPQVSEAVIRDATDVTGAAVTIPDEITNELVTNVMVKDGQTIVLGGLFRESTQSSRKQVPFLGDIPLIGTAFRGHEDEVQRSEIIFLITPSIVKDELLDRHGKAAKDYIDHARTGSREGLLPWSRDKMTGMKLIEAQKLAAAGDTEKARWKLQQSLSLNQNQPDAIGLLKELGGDVTTWSSRSLMEDIINNEVKTELKTSKFEYDPNHWPTPENHNGSHGVNHGAYQGEPVPPQTNATDDSASVTFTPGDAPSSQPTTEPAVDLVPTTTDGTDPNTDGFATPDSNIQPNTGSQTEPTPTDANFDNSTQPQADPQTEPTPEPTPASNEFVPPTPNETPSDTTNQTTPATPENDTTDQGVNTTGSSTSYDSGSIAGSTTPETATNSHTDTTTSTHTTNTTDSGATTNTDTAIAGTQAERQVAPTDASNTNTATSVAESSATSSTPVNTDSGATPTPDQAPDPTPDQTSDAASNATPSSTDSSPANTTESSPTSNTTNSTTAPTNNTNNTDTTGASSPTESAATEPTANSTAPSSDAAGTTPTEASNSTNPSNTDATADNTNTTTSASTDTTPTDYANQPNSGFEASESTTSQTANASTAGATNEASAGVVHGEKSNLDLLTNAINTQGGNQANTSENAENSPMSENSSSQNADNNTAAGSASDAQSTSQTQSQSQTTSKASAASKSKSKTGKEATAKELKPGKSDAATSKTTANSKTAKANTKANTKDSKAAKTKAAQEAKKKKSSWGIFDFLRPSDDDEKPETTVTKGQDDTGPPGEQK